MNAYLAGLIANPKEFVPYAKFDEKMDCVRVRLRDCSTCETVISKHLSVLYPTTHSRSNTQKIVGLDIYGLHSFGLSLDNIHRVSELIDAFVKKLPPEEAHELEQFARHREIAEMRLAA